MSALCCEIEHARVALAQSKSDVQNAINWWLGHGPEGSNDWRTYAEEAAPSEAAPEPSDPVPRTPPPPSDLPADASMQHSWAVDDANTNHQRDLHTPLAINGMIV